VALALQAIPEALGLLRYLSLNQTMGELVIVVREMTLELLYFIVLYLVSLIGFCICLRGLFYGEGEYTSNSSTALSVFSITFGGYDFSAFTSSNEAVNTVGVLLIVIIILFTSVLLINLIKAQMSDSYKKVKDHAFRQWAFSYARVVNQCMRRNDLNVLTMLPAPLNLIPVALAVPHYLVMFFGVLCQRSGNTNSSVKGRFSLAGLLINIVLDFCCLPLRHWRIYELMLKIVLRRDTLSILYVIVNTFGPIAYFISLPFIEISYHALVTMSMLRFDIMEEETCNVANSSSTWSFVDEEKIKMLNFVFGTEIVIYFYPPLPTRHNQVLSMELFDKFLFLNRNKSGKTPEKDMSSDFQHDMKLKFQSLNKNYEELDVSMKEVHSKFNRLDDQLNEQNAKLLSIDGKIQSLGSTLTRFEHLLEKILTDPRKQGKC
jgi:hypothetical protein